MADIRTWTPESDVLKPGEISGVQEIRSWFERLPRMRALIRQQQEHIESLRSAATTTTSSNSGAPGHSGTSDKVGTNSDAAMDAETKLAELKCQYAEMQKDAIDVAYLLHADPVSIKRSRCLILSFVEGKRHAEIAPEVGYSNPSQISRAISEGLAQLAELTNELNLSCPCTFCTMSEGIVFTRSGIYLLSASVLSWYHRQSRKGPPIYAVSEVHPPQTSSITSLLDGIATSHWHFADCFYAIH